MKVSVTGHEHILVVIDMRPRNLDIAFVVSPPLHREPNFLWFLDWCASKQNIVDFELEVRISIQDSVIPVCYIQVCHWKQYLHILNIDCLQFFLKVCKVSIGSTTRLIFGGTDGYNGKIDFLFSVRRKHPLYMNGTRSIFFYVNDTVSIQCVFLYHYCALTLRITCTQSQQKSWQMQLLTRHSQKNAPALGVSVNAIVILRFLVPNYLYSCSGKFGKFFLTVSVSFGTQITRILSSSISPHIPSS